LGTKIVKGIWNGVMSSSVKTEISEKVIDGCLENATVNNNLRVDAPK